MAFEFSTGKLSSDMVAEATDTGVSDQKAEPQKQDEAAKHGGLFGEIFADRKERTLAGCAIGTVRDAFSGKLTEEEKVKRAEGNDFVATIAADTAAMMSKKMAVGGLVRATMLADTKGDARDFALGFAKDGLEGVGLNYIGKMAQPGSRAFEYAGARLGTGLKQEIALHAGSGALFGALKAGSDPMAWRDQDGHFSFQSGLQNLTDWKKMSTATLSGALINVPAGMLGMRIAKSSTLSVANRTGSEALGTITGGVLSGGGSGAVFGGLDAIVHGKSLGEIGKSTFDGMLIGAGTGGVMSGWHAFRPVQKAPLETQLQEKLQPKAQETVQDRPIVDGPEQLAGKETAAVSEASVAKLTNALDRLTPEQQAKMFESHERVAYTSEPKEAISALNRRLTFQETGEIKLMRLKNDPDRPKTFESEAELQTWLETVTEPTRVYRIEGTNVKITIPEAYARKLDQIRELRVWAEVEAPSYDNLPDSHRKVFQKHIVEGDMDLIRHVFKDKADNIARIVKSRVELLSNPNNRRALPEDFIQAVKELPDPGLLKELVLLDEPYYKDAYNPDKAGLTSTSSRSAAHASRDGVITFFEQNNGRAKGATSGGSLNEFLMHEWSHLLKFKLKEHSALFNETAELENDWYVREYAKRQYKDTPDLQHHENFAVHMGEELLAPDADRFFITAHNAPLRTTMMAKALLEAMIPRTKEMVVHPADFLGRIDEIPRTMPNRDMHVARLKYVAEEIVPVAREKLFAGLASESLHDRLRSAMLLGRIGHQSDVPRAQEFLSAATDPQLKKALFHSVANISDQNINARLNFLIEHAQPGNPFREEALTAMSGFQHPDARAYYDALRLSGSEANLPELINLIDKTHVAGAKKMAFESVVRLSKSSPFAEDFMQSYLLKLLRTQPDIGVEVINEAVKHPSLAMEIEILHLMNSRDKAVAARAKQATAELQLARKLDRYDKWLKGGNDQHKWEAIQELAWMNDNRAVPMLLEVVATNNPKWAREAVEALRHYNPAIVAAEAHQMQRNGSNVRWGEVKRVLDAARR